MKPIDVQPDMLVFDNSSNVSKSGVMTITKKLSKSVERFCKEHNLSIKSVGGNNDTGEFFVYLNEELTLEQAEALLE